MITLAGDGSATPGARLAAVIDAAVLRPDLRLSAALRMEFVTAGLHDAQLRPLLAHSYEAWRDLLAEVVRAGTESGEFRRLLPPETLVACLVALVDGFELAVAVDVADAGSDCLVGAGLPRPISDGTFPWRGRPRARSDGL